MQSKHTSKQAITAAQPHEPTLDGERTLMVDFTDT
jgi:hypothetical protein